MEQTYKESKKELIIKNFWYIVIFSIIGLIVETLYCFFTTGVLESRKGLLWGPFCPVYGVGGVVIISLLNRYKDNNLKLLIYGFVLGSIIEYIISYILEAIYGIRFWEYSYISSNLNGRICITYSIFWGVLTLGIIKIAKPSIDWIINKIPYKKIITIALFIFLIIDVIFTIWGIHTYEQRAINKFSNTSNNIINKIENNYFTNERMRKNFPNLRIITEEGKEVFVRDIIE